MNRLLLLFLLCCILLNGCDKKPEVSAAKNSALSDIKLKYAEGFSIRRDSLCTWLEVRKPYQGASESIKYLLVPKGLTAPDHAPEVKVIRTPVSRVVCTSTTHIPLLDYLGESESLVGFPTTDYISSEKTRKLIDAGKVTDLGVDKGINIEVLSSLKPELLMGYTMTADYGQFKKIEELGIPVVLNAEYLERHPLGRAEWIKFISVFFNKEKVADSIFTQIEKRYLEAKALVSTSTDRVTVLSGIMYGDAWFLPGGKNYASTMLQDAGYNYLWREDPSHGFLELSFETVYEKANDADYWIGVADFKSLQEMANVDQRYSQFKAFRNKTVYNYDARRGVKGGNEYLELGYLRPDLILNDLVKISHPELLPEYQLFFYRQLK